MLLLLFLLCPFAAHAMENDSSSFFDSWHSYLEYALRSYMPVLSQVSLSPMQEVRESKNKFEEQLALDTQEIGITMIGSDVVVSRYAIKIEDGLFHADKIDANPMMFLRYCYNQRVHKECKNAINIDSLNGPLLDTCKAVQINGYSALGAAIIADVSLEARQKFMERLLQKGFMLTEKDKKLSLLKFHNEIREGDRKAMIMLLQDNQKGDFAPLPHDVRKYIVNYMVHVYKEEYSCYLLPWGHF